MQKIATLLAVFLASHAAGDEFAYKPVEAQYLLKSSLHSHTESIRQLDRLSIFLTGTGAKEIYDAMPGLPENGDLCEEGLRIKRRGALVCVTHDGEKHSCSFGILLSTGEMVPEGSC